MMAAHTHRGECGQKVPRLKKGLQKERNMQLTNRINRIHINNYIKLKLMENVKRDN